MAGVLLYQPYYSTQGHFKDFFRVYYDHLQNRGFDCHGIIGIKKSFELDENRNVSIFHRKFYSRKTRIFDNWRGLKLLITHLNKSPETYQIIQLLDVEIVILWLFLIIHNKHFVEKRLIIHLHSVNRLQKKKSLFNRSYRLLAKWAYRYIVKHFSTQIVTNGKFLSKKLKKITGLGEAIHSSKWGSDDLTDFVHTDQKERRTFLFFGIIREDKNLKYIMHQFGKINQQYKLIIAGQPRDYTRDKVINWVEKAGIPNENIELHLNYIAISKMYKLFNRAEYILIPYSAENLSNSGPLITGLQFNCIPIVSDYGERGNLAKNYKCGYTFKFDNKKDFTTILKHCIEKKDEAYLSKIRSIKKDFLWPNIIDELIYNDFIYGQE